MVPPFVTLGFGGWKAFVAMLPGFHVILMAKQGKDMFKHLQKGYQAAKQMTRVSPSVKVQMERDAQKNVAKQQEEKSRLQFFKLFEVIGESVPQSILQVFIVMKTAGSLPNVWNFIAHDISTLSTILSSVLSMVISAGSMLMETGFIINGEYIIPYHQSGLTAMHTLLMVPVVISRALAISLIFASFEGWYALIPASIGGMLYFILASRIHKRFERSVSSAGKLVFIGMASLAIFMPCAIVNPQWNLLIYFSSLSAFVLSLILAVLCLIAYANSDLLTSSIVHDIQFYYWFCGTLIGLMLFSILITTFQVWLVRRNHQTFLFHCAYGNTEVVESMLLANEAETNFNEVNCNQWTGLHLAVMFDDFDHWDIVTLILRHGNSVGFDFNARSGDGHTAYHYVCMDRKEEKIELFKTHSGPCGIDLNVVDEFGYTAEPYRYVGFSMGFDVFANERTVTITETDAEGKDVQKRFKLKK